VGPVRWSKVLEELTTPTPSIVLAAAPEPMLAQVGFLFLFPNFLRANQGHRSAYLPFYTLDHPHPSSFTNVALRQSQLPQLWLRIVVFNS